MWQRLAAHNPSPELETTVEKLKQLLAAQAQQLKALHAPLPPVASRAAAADAEFLSTVLVQTLSKMNELDAPEQFLSQTEVDPSQTGTSLVSVEEDF